MSSLALTLLFTAVTPAAASRPAYTADNAKHVMWVYGPGFPCTEVPLGAAEAKANSREEAAGNETIDGHPAKKVKVTTTTPRPTTASGPSRSSAASGVPRTIWRICWRTAAKRISKRSTAPVIASSARWATIGSGRRSSRRRAQRNIVLSPKMIGIFPSLGVTMSMRSQRVYMLYLAVPNTESLAILINYHPAGRGVAADDATWKHFVDSVRAVR